MSKKVALRLCVLSLLIMALAVAGMAQTTASIKGNVTDPSGAAVAGAKVLVKPTSDVGKPSTYRGVIFVRDDSPLRSLESLAGKTIVLVRATAAGRSRRNCKDSKRRPERSWSASRKRSSSTSSWASPAWRNK